MIQYKSISTDILKVEMEKHGFADIKLSGFRATACRKIFDKLRQLDNFKREENSIFIQFWLFVRFIAGLIYVFIFHRNILSLMSFYYVEDDISYKGRSLPDGSFNFRFEKKSQ